MSELRSLIEEGLNLSEIAKRKGVSRQAVSLWAKSEGIDFQQVIRERELVKVKRIQSLARKGLSRFEIAESLPDVPFNTICKLICKHKIKVVKQSRTIKRENLGCSVESP